MPACNQRQGLTVADQASELVRIASDPNYFARTYIKIKSDESYEYVPFTPWPHQERLLDELDLHKYHCWLKARQLGMTATVLAYSMWVALVEPNSLVFLVSKQLDDSCKLIEKLKLMWQRLPEWLQQRFNLVKDNAGAIAFSNGGTFLAFASNKSVGDGMTARLAIVDEADLIADVAKVLNGIGPAVAKGGQLVLLSKSNKDLPNSKFKQIFREAMKGNNDYKAQFLPWWCRPDRDQDFYDAEVRNAGSIDHTWSNYPASIDEAFAPRQESKRLPLKWLESCAPSLDAQGLRQWPKPVASPAVLAGVSGLRIFYEPEAGRTYDIGVDLASGKGENPNLDDSAAVILDHVTMKQVAVLADRIEPTVMAGYVAALARYYNMASVLVEQNGQWGGSCITHLKDKHPDIRLLRGPHGDIGFNTTANTKIDLYQKLSDGARCGGFTISDQQKFEQLASIEGRTLEAPKSFHDDIAMAFGLAVWAAEEPGTTPFVIVTGPPEPKPEPTTPLPKVDTSWQRIPGSFPRIPRR
jgi:hypothetical protein